MEILISSNSDIYTVTFNTTSKTITIAGVNNFPLDYTSIRELYDVTAGGNVTPLSSPNQFSWFRSNGLPIFVYGFTKLPGGASNGDTLTLLLDIPQNQSILSLQQKQASAAAGSPGTLVAGETPTGTINSSNKVFTLANTPITGAITLIYASPGDAPVLLNYGVDFTVSGSTVTLVNAPITSSTLYSNYYH